MATPRTLNAEVRGQALDAVLASVSALAPATRTRVQTILADADLLHVEPDDWYSLDEVLDVLEEVEGVVGEGVLRRVGTQLATVAAAESSADDPLGVLHNINDVYAAYHRGPDAGGIDVEAGEANTATVVSTTPYSDHFERGMLEGALAGRNPSETYAHVKPRTGYGTSERTVYDVRW